MANILVIDDDQSVRFAIQQALKSSAHSVRLACDGNEGIKLHRASPADLIISDLFMPEKEGIETIQEIRRESPNVPIIAISGGYTVSEPMLAVAERMGATKVLQKPFDTYRLLDMIEEVLGGGDKKE